jgi:putative membrane protein
MRPSTLFLISLLSAFTLTAAAAALPTVNHGSQGQTGTSTALSGKAPRCGVIRVHDVAGFSDGEIAYLYLQANLFEVETAELARAQGVAPQVKQHGDEVARDHRGVIKMFEELLLKNGVKPVTVADSAKRVAAQDEVLADLKAKSGADFDRAYVAHEVENHRAVIKVVRDTFIPETSNGQLAAHFKEVLPAFEHHLAMTIDAAKALGVDTDN